MQGLNPEQRRDRTFLSLERILDTASANTPLLILIDDLQWADVLSLGFTDRLIQMIGANAAHNRSAMFLFLCRPIEELETTLGQLLAQLTKAPHRTLRLAALDANQSERLVAALLDQHMPADLLHLVIEHAQGNPFYVEEVLRSFIEDGTLYWEKTVGEWQVTRAVSDVRIPASVQDVLAARIDRLPPNDKRITQRAAIIGRTFWQHLLMQIVEVKNVESTLLLLEMRQLADRLSQSQIAEDWEWVFRHILIQEVAYAMVPKAVRRSVHQQIAHYLEAQVGEQATFLFPLIAYHYEQGNLPQKAIEYLYKAGEQAAARFANEDTVDYFTRAITLLDKLPKEARRAATVKEQQYALLLGREGVFRLLAQHDAQANDLVQLQALADELDNNHYRAEVALRFANYYDATSDFSAALIAAQNAVRWAEQAADPARKVEGLIAGAQALWRRGVYQEAQPQLEEALALARQRGNQRGEANSLHQLGTVLYFLGDPPSARNHLEQALSLRRALHDIAGEAGSLNNIVAVYHGLGDFAKAKECCEQSLNIYRMIGNRRDEATALNNLGVMRHTLGNFAAARDDHEHALALFQALGDRRGQSLAANNLGLAFHDLGDYEKARHYCEQALATRQSIGDRRGEGYSLTYLGLALEGLGALAEAHTAYEKAMHLRRDIGQAAAAIDDLAGLARIALKQNQPARAETYAEEARQWIREHGIQGIVHPLRVYLTCADVAAAMGKTEQATEFWHTAHNLLLEQAARISDQATRQVFLESVPIHNEVLNRMAYAVKGK
jgi:predicted ATPase